MKPSPNQLILFAEVSHANPFQLLGKCGGGADSRSLWAEMFGFIRHFQPEIVIAENVGGLLSKKFAMELDTILLDLENAGYTPQIFNIPAAGAGYPHHRQRIWIVGLSNTNSHRRNWRVQFGGSIDEKKGQLSTVAGLPAFQIRSWDEIDNPQPVLFRKNAGLSPTVDKYTAQRVKALGNSICPAVAYEIIKAAILTYQQYALQNP